MCLPTCLPTCLTARFFVFLSDFFPIFSKIFPVTPFNVIRAIRQVQTVEKSLILPAITFSDFIKQIVEDVDPITHGIIFELLVELVYNPAVFEGNFRRKSGKMPIF